MLHAGNEHVRPLLLKGRFGLEKESLRVTPDGYFAHTPHPFMGEEHIVRDFCENQTEINTPVVDSAHEAVQALQEYTVKIQKQLQTMPERELLWPFSNPPFIRNEADVPIAQFIGDMKAKTDYREYLSDRYGRYKMTLSGIHVNYSFADELLQADFALSGKQDFAAYKNSLYLSLAESAAAYGWILTALTAASPLTDSSFVEKGRFGEDEFSGMASVRCSELGYWNYFAVWYDYTDLKTYADSIRFYVNTGLLAAPSELYYPIRLKPPGRNDLDALVEKGVDHIELRMFDLNPLTVSGADERDLVFAQLFLVWLAAEPCRLPSIKAQVQAVQNFKNAAHYDLKTVKILLPDGEVASVADAGVKVIERMKVFYHDFPQDVQSVLDFELQKFLEPEKRYAWQVRTRFANSFVTRGMILAEQKQQEACCV
ncbi:MAG: hypothetical protein IJ752_06235 [Alphaproteobacteria bacterium]|nr:hypothetical protein [Alphaproteobacteria bacterium]